MICAHECNQTEPGKNREMKLPRFDLSFFYRSLLILSGLSFAAALLGFAYTGIFTRYWADDYCYNAVLNVDGFWKSQVSFYQHTSDRFSVIPLVGISEAFGSRAIRFWPVVALLLALVALLWAFRQLARTLNLPLSFLERFLLAEMVLFFTLWQAPNLFQAFYWRTGMLTYFMPLIVNLFLAGCLLALVRRRPLPAWGLLAVALLAFFAGGFSETTAALQAGYLGLALVIVAFLPWRSPSSTRQKGLSLLAVAIFGALVSMLALFLSPSNALRQVHMPDPAPLMVLLGSSFRFGLDFITDTVATQPLPTLLSFLSPLLLSGLHTLRFDRAQANHRLSSLLVALPVVLLGGYLLIVCCVAPSVYVEVAYPEPRALIAARLTMTLTLVVSAWLSGVLAVRFLRALPFLARQSSPLWIGAALLFALLALYPLRSARTVYAELPAYQQRAAAWDARDRDIRLQQQQGQLDVSVVAFDSIGGLMELQPEPDSWLNHCVAGAYRLRSITGVNP